jgi:hypothetical protein
MSHDAAGLRVLSRSGPKGDTVIRVLEGQRFKVSSDWEVVGLSQWKAPFTGDFKCVIPAGTVVVALNDQIEGRPGFACRPEQYEELLRILVPVGDRENQKFNGYYFVFLSEEIGKRLEGPL